MTYCMCACDTDLRPDVCGHPSFHLQSSYLPPFRHTAYCICACNAVRNASIQPAERVHAFFLFVAASALPVYDLLYCTCLCVFSFRK